MQFLVHPSTVAIVIHACIVAGLTVRVIMKRPPTGTALAWLSLISILPLAGAALYLSIGERRVGRWQVGGIEDLRIGYREIVEAAAVGRMADIDWSRQPVVAAGMDRLGRNTIGAPTVHGSSFEIFADNREILRRIADDVKGAKHCVLMEFYIWSEGGLVDLVVDALIEAAGRGVSCRVLVDAMGARAWWKGDQPGRLRNAGVDLRPALPVGFVRAIIGRTDLRLHRKIVVIDGETAWTGSMNMVDPDEFKDGSGIGEWVDAMARLQGAAVATLGAVVVGDWKLESGDAVEPLIESSRLKLVEPAGDTDIQVVPSGPGDATDGILQLILALLHSAQEELILTTPYLVPDESVLRALRGAAGRDVRVTLIVPRNVDSVMARHASRSYFEDLMNIGVEIYMYEGGLLHTKSILVDGELAMLGTVNLDMRSLWLNKEVAMFVYDRAFGARLREVQMGYLADAEQLNLETWNERPLRQKFVENAFRLASPVL